MTTPVDEAHRTAQLLAAQQQAEMLFVEIEERGLIRPAVTEQQVSDEIRDLAADMFGLPSLAQTHRPRRREHHTPV